MEFHLKLQELRKKRGLTQEELAEAIFVSRTAVSKWESGKGYPGIESLKELSRFYSVSIDELLSADAVISLAEKENRTNLRGAYYLLFALVDVLHLAMIFLPLYPKEIAGHIYSVSLPTYGDFASHGVGIYWGFFLLLVVIGVVELVMIKVKANRLNTVVTNISVGASIVTVLLLVIFREVYATVLALFILIIKGILLLKSSKTLA